MTPKQAALQAREQKRRIPELEPTILQSGIASCFYAKEVVKGRWQEGESAIAQQISHKYVNFNILDEDDRAAIPSPLGGSYRVGPRPVGTEHVKSGNELRLMAVYMRLAKCRVPAFESVLAGQRWKGDGLAYCQTIYRTTGELIDLDRPDICAWMIGNLALNRSAKKISRSERLRVCNELHKRMILHSFAHGDNREVRNYFAAQKKAENHFLIMLSQHDPEMKVGDLIHKVVAG